jgi:hypothetical protein
VSQVDAGGNIGAAYTLATAGGTLVRLRNVILNAAVTITLGGLVAGKAQMVQIIGAQDAVGSRTLSIDDGSGAKQVAIPMLPSALFEVHVDWDGATAFVYSPGAQGPAGTPGTNGMNGANGTNGTNGSSGALMPKVVSPVLIPSMVTTGGGVLTSLKPIGCRLICPAAGVLHDLAWQIFVSSGNVAVAIYDTGDASAGNRTLLWSSGSLACGPTNSWQTADPALTVLAGQQLDAFLMFDNATASVGRISLNAQNEQLPASFNPVPGGASPKLAFTVATLGSLTAWGATIAEGNVLLNSSAVLLTGRIV